MAPSGATLVALACALFVLVGPVSAAAVPAAIGDAAGEATADPDGDLLDNDTERRLGTDPLDADTDDDGLDDGREVLGWTVRVIVRDGEPYRWAGDRTPNGWLHVTSDPLSVDTDDDGATDREEFATLHTDPRDPVTYSATERRQRLLDAFYARWRAENGTDGHPGLVVRSARAVGLLAPGDPPEMLDRRLTDATDDFDLVLSDAGGLVFRALDGARRTDTWLSNAAESTRGLDPWDPDTDDDGLTDGQEARWLTRATRVKTGENETHGVVEMATRIATDPANPDTDGDGWWDGRVGVHGVGRSANVVLYREHLLDRDGGAGGGVRGDETVPQQTGVHDVDAAPSSTGVDVDGDGTREHANIHLGERHWGTDPADPLDRPRPQVAVEVDYYTGAAVDALNDTAWERGIEANYALYGIDVDVRRDGALDGREIAVCVEVVLADICVEPDDGFGVLEIVAVERRHHDTPADIYLLVVDRAQETVPEGDDQTGIDIPVSPAQALFTDAHRGAEANVPETAVSNSPYTTAMALVAAKTELHELGHALHAGEADDVAVDDGGRISARRGEIYSGSSDDPTPERAGDGMRWSVMTSGWHPDLLAVSNGSYFAFSIEELLTIRR